jgi:hypothetical protein
VGYVAIMGESRSVYIILMGNHEDMRLFKTQEQMSRNMKTDVK